MENYLRSTRTLDWESPSVKKKAEELTNGKYKDQDRIGALFYFVRDQIPYRLFKGIPDMDFFKASGVRA